MSVRYELEGVVLRLYPTHRQASTDAPQYMLDNEDYELVCIRGCGWLALGRSSHRVVDADGIVSSKINGYFKMLAQIFLIVDGG